jgi:ABC-2 type transport system ATP-binding protein
MKTEFEKKRQEIQGLVASDHLNLAANRLMDFVRDFSPHRRRVREVIAIKARWNELRTDKRRYGDVHRILRRTQEFRHHILEFLDCVYDESLKAGAPGWAAIGEGAGPRLVPAGQTPENHKEDAEVPRTQLEMDKARFAADKLSKKPLSDVAVAGQGVTHSRKSRSIDFNLGPLDLTIRLGELAAVVGENGSGKTTLLAVVAGRLRNDDGVLTYPALSDRTSPYSIRQQISYLPEELPSWPGRVSDTLHFSAAAHGLRGSRNELEVDFVIHRLELEKYKEASWNELSSGYKMRFSLAKALLRRPKILILDEPLANLDINSQTRFLQDLRDLVDSVSNPMAVLISSQHLYRAESIADSVIFLQDGVARHNGSLALLEDDSENIYVLECSASREELMNSLEKIDYRSIEVEGSELLIVASSVVTNDMILSALGDSDVSVKSFRDISRSTRKLFRRTYD